MAYELIDEELNLWSCSISDLTIKQAEECLKQWECDAALGTLTLFYDQHKDMVVLNQENADYDTYISLCKTYLLLDNERRWELYNKLEHQSLKDVAETLDRVLEVRMFKREIGIAMGNKIYDADRSVLQAIIHTDSNRINNVYTAFRYGVIQGKREERTRRKASADERKVSGAE